MSVANSSGAESTEHRRIELSRCALRTIEAEVALGGLLLETGGILLGHDSADGVPRVTVAGSPGPNAVREPLRFSRDREHAERIADQAWRGHAAVWLGDWHTHPGGSPVPSEIDMASYGRHLADPELGFTRFVSIIVGLPAVGTGAKIKQAGQAEHARHARHAVLVAWLVETDSARTAELNIFEEPHHG